MAAGAILLALGLTACGGSGREATESGSLAEAAPASADFYGEVLVRPTDELSERLDGLFEAFDAEPDEEWEGLRAEVLPDLRRWLGAEEDVGYEDIEPWLGSRVGFFYEVTFGEISPDLSTFGEAPRFGEGAALIEVSDADAARELLEELFGELVIEDPSVEYQRRWNPTIILLEDLMLIGDEAAVDAARATYEGDDRSLEQTEWLRTALEPVDDDTAIGFIAGSARTATRASLFAELDELDSWWEAQQIERLIDPQLPVDPSPPGTTTFVVEEGKVAIEWSHPLRDEVALDEARLLFERLPADSWLALAEPIAFPTLIASFAAGVEVGMRRPRITRQQSYSRLGYDPRESLDRFTGQAAVFARGELPDGLVAGGVLGVDSEGPGYAVDAVRLLLADQPGFELREPLEFGGPWGFEAEIDGLPAPIVATEIDGRLGVVLRTGGDDEEAEAALSPTETIGGSARLRELEDLVGPEWTVLGYADLERLRSLIPRVGSELELVSSSSAGFLESTPSSARLVATARAEEGRLVERYWLFTE